MKGSAVFVLLVLLVLTAGTLWAGGQEEAEKIRIVHVHWTQPPYDEINLASAESFMEEHPNVEVKMLLYPDSERGLKVKTALSSGGEVDTFAMGSWESSWYMDNGLVVEIMPSAFGKDSVAEVVDMWWPNAMEGAGGFHQGKYYGIPHEMSNYAAWINTRHMQEAGLSPQSDIPRTWEDFTRVGQKLTVDQGGVRVRNGFAMNLKFSVFAFEFLHSMLAQKGYPLTSEKAFYDSLFTREALAVLTTITNWATVDKMFDPGLFEDEREGFGNGLCSEMLTGGSWYWGVLDEYTVPREDVAPFAWPRYRDAKADVAGMTWGYCGFVAEQTKNKEWGFRWLDYLERQPEAYIVHGYIQPRKTLDMALASQYIPDYELFAREMQKGPSYIPSTKFDELSDAWGAAVNRVVFEKVTNADSMKTLQQDVKDILEY